MPNTTYPHAGMQIIPRREVGVFFMKERLSTDNVVPEHGLK